jgi:transcription-repair coupling factor (superfamily II helicase)
VSTLLRFSALKSLAQRTGVESIDRRAGVANIKFHQQSKVDPVKLMTFVRTLDGVQFTPAGVLKVPLRASIANAAGLIEELKNVLLELTTSEPVASTC